MKPHYVQPTGLTLLIAGAWLIMFTLAIIRVRVEICEEIKGVRTELHALTAELRRHRAR